MIRPATLDDIPVMVEMGRKFADRSGVEVGFCPDSVASLLAGLIENGICLVGENCMAGAVLFDHPFNRSHKAAQELFWWSEGRNGLRLLDALETAVREAGAHSLTMITLEAVNPETTGKLYARKGFRVLEHSYMKVF
ncbi:hypothetical protein [Sphingopyxis witflariensis]|uniref:N-acetyltransferase domain-containing protein n=1 Tax=Sphingopyxis witflariensis TaxID=173675 RepID=A0A246JYM4_9SPHN|nr:hypothetical protein [Sphingopyxis witflariensis]OWQ98020.1 hypothetical protein CDQ91_10395 [Sphingopyxis witflariensis]